MSRNRFETYLDALEPWRQNGATAQTNDADRAQWRADARARLERADLLEAYLDELEAPLIDQGVSDADRDDWRAEARQHLLTIAEAREELGEEAAPALRSALRSFGDAAVIGDEVGRQTKRLNGQNRTAARAVAAGAAGGIIAAAFYALISLGPVAASILLAKADGLLILLTVAFGGATTSFLAARGEKRAWAWAGATLGALLSPIVAANVGMLPATITDRSDVTANAEILLWHFRLYGVQAALAGALIWRKRSGTVVAALGTALLDLAVTFAYWNYCSVQSGGTLIPTPADLAAPQRVIFIMGGVQHLFVGLFLSWGRKGAGRLWRATRENRFMAKAQRPQKN